ncbi:ESCRT-III subunit protein VPS24 NDAI_0K01780 [Naumovozyma dairenensis CBS 421]|uniref:Vacuolar protein-sorting-associated protein 24 n=1 Tax=Naumovozyma dairenensis (strain ATCC 10597 / BCRC 20456 / CBS 421 / NBRC 0211 / NRRL Y-12639) TaxID=1071378 RepID=G0WHV8_NAUDC|nr:hypothetical protein NDAI_0K01780 [Naumovozyma dairenensis CBS 421]CCD27369.1 hypothetical protein NDAI_0K01780 [Naumovozyma dairenensis CBS 421]
MDYFKKAIWGPDPKEQQRTIKTMLKKNSRAIEKSLRELSALQKTSQQLIKRSAKKNDIKAVRTYAKELYAINKQYERMYTSKAQLESVSMKIEEAFKMKNLSEQMGQSTGLMMEVNSLVRLPELQGTMMELEKELMKSGIISEMIDDTMEAVGESNEEMEEEADAEVNKIIEQYTTEKFNKVNEVPVTDLDNAEPQEEEKEVPEEQVDEEADKMLREMKERLNALQN